MVDRIKPSSEQKTLLGRGREGQEGRQGWDVISGREGVIRAHRMMSRSSGWWKLTRTGLIVSDEKGKK